jgi:Rps23 Pro-64 3,4-dihydroxylase Tpa1-like proline 4-hydroxylase
MDTLNHLKSEWNDFLSVKNFEPYQAEWKKNEPFNHIVLENFLQENIARSIVQEFPSFQSKEWLVYDNAIEIKKVLNHWDKFGPETYQLFFFLNSRAFIAQLERLVGCPLYADFGLNGGGLHTHRQGGKLNVHLDYSMHPKLRLERKINLLIYITPEWKEDWGGLLGFWEQDKNNPAPGALKKTIAPVFNRAVLFDTTQNSWHGLPEAITCPKDITRNSLAVYYLCDPAPQACPRGKALFAPYGEQINDPEVLALIEKRSQINSASDVYRKK